MLIGNVGKEPEVRYVGDGICTAQVSLATTTRGYTLPNGTQVPDKTEWHHLLFWRKLAEVVEKYVHKGDKLYVEGEIRTRSYSDYKGDTRYITEIWVNNMEMLSSKNPPAQAQTPQGASIHSPAVGTKTDTTPSDVAQAGQEDLPF